MTWRAVLQFWIMLQGFEVVDKQKVQNRAVLCFCWMLVKCQYVMTWDGRCVKVDILTCLPIHLLNESFIIIIQITNQN